MPPGNVDKTAQVSRAGVLPDYAVETDMERRYTEVSEGFCKVLGYTRRELIGKRVDEITAPRSNDIQVVFELFLKCSYMHGIWIFLNRAQNLKIFVRYEAWLRSDLTIECTMELIGGGA
jgi:PAS domain-containing protein